MRYEALIHVVVEVDDADLLKAAALAAHAAAHHGVDDFWAAQVTATPEQSLESVLAGPPMFDGLTATVGQYDGLRLVGFHVSHPEIDAPPDATRLTRSRPTDQVQPYRARTAATPSRRSTSSRPVSGERSR